ncbi:unnamed protein product [Urochloa humidicola]
MQPRALGPPLRTCARFEPHLLFLYCCAIGTHRPEVGLRPRSGRGHGIERTIGSDSMELVNQVRDEIGIDINSKLVKAPATAFAKPVVPGKIPAAQAEAAGGRDGGIDDDLQVRLELFDRMFGKL